MTTAEARWKMSCAISSLLLDGVTRERRLHDYFKKILLTNIRFKSVKDIFRCGVNIHIQYISSYTTV